MSNVSGPDGADRGNTRSIRQQKFRAIVEKFGAQEVARRMDLARKGATKGGEERFNTSYIGHLKEGRRPITEEQAAKIEVAFDLSPGELSRMENDVRDPLDSTREIITEALAMIEARAAQGGASLSPDKKARIVMLVHKAALKGGTIDPAYVQELVELAK